jgi:MFS family permease
MSEGLGAARGSAGSRRLFAPWYLAYLILGLINSGMLPFLLPLAMAASGHDLDTIAYAIGAYNVGMLPAPLLGILAERRRLFRSVFFSGFIVVSLALACLPEISNLTLWVILAFLTGFGVGSVATVAPLFVVDFAPKDEWEARIGWLQSFNGAGQLVGLLIVGVVAMGPLSYGFWLSSAAAILAIAVGRIGLPTDGHRRQSGLPRLAWGDAMGRVQPAPAIGGLLQHSHQLQEAAWHRPPKDFRQEFSCSLLAWASLNLGVAPFFAYYPLMMDMSYRIPPTTTALLYALAAAVGIALFAFSGRMAQRFGPGPVFRSGLALRAVGFGSLAFLSLIPVTGGRFLAMFAFALIMLAWPVLSVSGTVLVARLTPIGEGAAMGLLAASGAVATVLGTFLGGPLVEALGYPVVPLVALTGLAGAELLVRKGKQG